METQVNTLSVHLGGYSSSYTCLPMKNLENPILRKAKGYKDIFSVGSGFEQTPTPHSKLWIYPR
jgi:hypothetical protein